VTTQPGPGWKNFNKTNVRALVGDSSVPLLAVRRDGRGYFGFVEQVTDNYVELSNGGHRQNLYFNGIPIQFMLVEIPAAPTYKLGAPRLI